jgi:hypothetical protein
MMFSKSAVATRSEPLRRGRARLGEIRIEWTTNDDRGNDTKISGRALNDQPHVLGLETVAPGALMERPLAPGKLTNTK